MGPQKHTPKGIDGIYVRKPRSSQPVFKPNAVGSIHSPKNPRSNAIPQQDARSLTAMNLPNNSYSAAKAKSRTKKTKSKKPWSRKRKVITTVLTILVVILGLSGWFGTRILGSLDKVFHGNIFSDAQALFSQANLKGESSGRVNILVAGDSADDPGHGGADLTDSIMILSINTKNHTAFMLSVPRDLWVYIPGLKSYQKINACNNVTNFNQQGYPYGGMGQLEQVIQTNLGIPIDYYALVNYGDFKDSVNAVGGITIDVNSPDPRGLYDRFTNLKLPNGEDNLNGQVALELARARGDGVAGDVSYGFPNSDFTRTMYQREMVVAILKKATSAGVLANPLKVTSLFSSLSNNVKTDLTLQDTLTLDQLTKGLNISTIGSYAYSYNSGSSTPPILKSYTDPSSGQEALIPSAGINNFAALKSYYQSLITTNPIAKEQASVEVLNGTSITGLATQQQQILESKDISNVSVADTVSSYQSTVIVDRSEGKVPNTKNLLVQLYPGTVVTSAYGSTEAKEAAKYTDAFVVILGQNFANTTSTASNTSGSNTGG